MASNLAAISLPLRKRHEVVSSFPSIGVGVCVEIFAERVCFRELFVPVFCFSAFSENDKQFSDAGTDPAPERVSVLEHELFWRGIPPITSRPLPGVSPKK